MRNNEYSTKEGTKSSLRWEENKFRLNKLGYVKVEYKRDIDGIIKEATIIKQNGHWFLCIVYELEKIEPIEKFSEHGPYVGIDVGLTDFITFSNGKVIPKPDLKKNKRKNTILPAKTSPTKRRQIQLEKNTQKTPTMDRKEKQHSKRLLP